MLIICNQAYNLIIRGFTYARSTIGELSRVPCSVVQWTEPHGILISLYDGELYLSENYNLSPLVLIPLLVYNNYGSARLLWNWMYTLYILCYSTTWLPQNRITPAWTDAADSPHNDEPHGQIDSFTAFVLLILLYYPINFSILCTDRHFETHLSDLCSLGQVHTIPVRTSGYGYT